MGRQIIILGASGSFNIDHAVQLTQLAGTLGLQVLHASIYYDGDRRTHFAVGGPSDLQQDFAALGATVQCVLAEQTAQVEPGADWAGAVKLPEDQLAEVLTTVLLNGTKLDELLAGAKKKEPGGPKALAHLEAHQVRVVMEKAALEDLIVKLDGFITTSPVFQGLPEAERERLVRQKSCMVEYAGILHERIVAFPAPPPKKKKGPASSEEPSGPGSSGQEQQHEQTTSTTTTESGSEEAKDTTAPDGAQKDEGGAEQVPAGQTGGEGR